MLSIRPTSAGAVHNEDAVWLLTEPGEWELAAILDAHNSAESAHLVVDTLSALEPRLRGALGLTGAEAVQALHELLITEFTSEKFRGRSRTVRGETSLLVAARRGNILCWLSVGDCVLYLLHPEFARLGQYAVNQRQFFEWLGSESTFNSGVPSYTMGTRELRPGRNVMVLLTDGLLECGDRRFSNGRALYDIAMQPDVGGLEAAGSSLVGYVESAGGRDSATVVAWGYENIEDATLPSA